MRGILTGLFGLLLAGNAYAACDDIKTRSFNEARNGRLDEAVAILKDMDSEASCSASAISNAKFALAAFFVQKAVEAGDAKPFSAGYTTLIVKADGLNTYWQAAARLGDIQASARRFGDAATSYQRAIFLLETSLKPITPAERKYVVQRAEETRQLAAEKGNGDSRALFVAMQPNHRGGTGGEYGESAGRGITGEKVPTPIVFEYDSDRFTPEGQQYAAELLSALGRAAPAKITVIGHTDRRGGDDYNIDLSKRRALAVARYLLDGGLKADIQVVARGKRDPRDLTDPSVYSQEEIDALNRRVEVSWGQ